MKQPIRPLIILLVAVGMVAGLIFAYRAMREEREAEAGAEAPVVAPSRVQRGPDGRPALNLDVATQARLGLQTAVLAAGSARWEITANARVLDPASLTAQLDEIRAAKAALTAARKPYERTRALYQNGLNASAAAVETAEARVTQASIALDAAQDRLAENWGPDLVRRDDLPELARSIRGRERALVRIDLLAADVLTGAPTSARLFRLTGKKAATTRVLGPAPRTDSTVAGESWLTLVETNAATLVPGALLTARLATGNRDKGVVLPRAAVVRQAGRAWVYVKQDDTLFARREVSLDRPHPDGWLVSGEWPDPVVVAGAQSLLSEELKGRIQMKD